MIVEDDPDTLDFLCAAVRGCGAVVWAAANGPDAVRLAAEKSPHVVVSDIAMPGHDGYWVVSELRRLHGEDARALPVIAVTAYGREHSRERALAAGFAEHVRKPVDPDTLCDVVARVIDA